MFGGRERANMHTPLANIAHFPSIWQFATLVFIATADGKIGVSETYGLLDPTFVAAVAERHPGPAKHFIT